MIKRIVKLTLQEDKVNTFLQIFEESKNKIRAFDGCEHLELWQDLKCKNIVFTYSYWTSEKELNEYRKSEFFGLTWKKSKALFAEKAEAWSIKMLNRL